MADLGGLTNENKEATLQKFRSELQGQMMQELMTKLTENCFKVKGYG
jgi:hypothetical protein